MDKMMISTDRMINAAEARKSFGKMLQSVALDSTNYFVILQNGKLAALLVHPLWLKEKANGEFPNLEELRGSWRLRSADLGNALSTLSKLDKKHLPSLLK